MDDYYELLSFSSIIIYEVDTTFAEKSRTYYSFAIDGKLSNEYFLSDEEAIVQAIAAKYMGTRGAGGTAVGTAADWFMKMIGAETL